MIRQYNSSLRFLASLWRVSICLAAIAVPATGLALDQLELNTKRTLWQSSNTKDYEFISTKLCYCTLAAREPSHVAVRSNSIVSVIGQITLEPHDPAEYFTVDSMFNRLQLALDTNGIEVDAQFDTSLGFPTFFSINNPVLADDEFTYAIQSFSAVRRTGDFNGDEQVNAADYVLWRSHSGSDINSYAAWRGSFGQLLTASTSVAAVPEPSLLGVSIFAGALIAPRRRKIIW